MKKLFFIMAAISFGLGEQTANAQRGSTVVQQNISHAPAGSTIIQQNIVITGQMVKKYYAPPSCTDCDCFGKSRSKDYNSIPEPFRSQYMNINATFCQRYKLLSDRLFTSGGANYAWDPVRSAQSQHQSNMLMNELYQLNNWYIMQTNALLNALQAAANQLSSGYVNQAPVYNTNESNYASGRSTEVYSSNYSIPETKEEKDRRLTIEFANSSSAMENYLAGVFYYNGTNGVSTNRSEALRLFRKSADKGYLSAQRQLGFIYLEEKEYSNAMKYGKMAAEQGDADSQNNVGWMYENGFGIGTNQELAISWYERAAAQGNTTARINLRDIYNNVAALRDINKISDAKAEEYFRKAINLGNETAKLNLGSFYFNQERYNDAFPLLLAAAEAGNANDLNTIGYMYANGYGIAKDINKALTYYEKAIAGGNSLATSNAEVLYAIAGYDYLIDGNYAKAEEYYRKAIAYGNEGAKQILQEIINEKNVNKDFELLKTNAKNTYEEAKQIGFDADFCKIALDYINRALRMQDDSELRQLKSELESKVK